MEIKENRSFFKQICYESGIDFNETLLQNSMHFQLIDRFGQMVKKKTWNYLNTTKATTNSDNYSSLKDHQYNGVITTTNNYLLLPSATTSAQR